jgi:ADP-ribose pyrophosphatase YjhB (NUDIX family)
MRIYYLEQAVDFHIKPDADLNNIPSREELMKHWQSSNPNPLSVYFPSEASRTHWLETAFVSIHAAGGLVVNKEQQILFMMRRGKWDLPKGKMEEGETPETAALREIEEETGLMDLLLVHPLIQTYHLYEEKNQWMLKTSHWYLVLARKTDSMKPQAEEDITALHWFDRDQLYLAEQNTFANIRLVMQAYLMELPNDD